MTWRQILQGNAVTKWNVLPALLGAKFGVIHKGLTRESILKGWKKVGMHPWDPKLVWDNQANFSNQDATVATVQA